MLQQLSDANYPLAGDSGSDTTRDKNQRASYLKNVYTTMIIANYNLGVEHEHLHEYALSMDYFNKAQQLNREQLANDAQMARFIEDGLRSVHAKL